MVGSSFKPTRLRTISADSVTTHGGPAIPATATPTPLPKSADSPLSDADGDDSEHLHELLTSKSHALSRRGLADAVRDWVKRGQSVSQSVSQSPCLTRTARCKRKAPHKHAVLTDSLCIAHCSLDYSQPTSRTSWSSRRTCSLLVRRLCSVRPAPASSRLSLSQSSPCPSHPHCGSRSAPLALYAGLCFALVCFRQCRCRHRRWYGVLRRQPRCWLAALISAVDGERAGGDLLMTSAPDISFIFGTMESPGVGTGGYWDEKGNPRASVSFPQSSHNLKLQVRLSHSLFCSGRKWPSMTYQLS